MKDDSIQVHLYNKNSGVMDSDLQEVINPQKKGLIKIKSDI